MATWHGHGTAIAVVVPLGTPSPNPNPKPMAVGPCGVPDMALPWRAPCLPNLDGWKPFLGTILFEVSTGRYLGALAVCLCGVPRQLPSHGHGNACHMAGRSCDEDL